MVMLYQSPKLITGDTSKYVEGRNRLTQVENHKKKRSAGEALCHARSKLRQISATAQFAPLPAKAPMRNLQSMDNSGVKRISVVEMKLHLAPKRDPVPQCPMISWDMFAPTYASIAIAITVKRSEEDVCSVTIQVDPCLPCSCGVIGELSHAAFAPSASARCRVKCSTISAAVLRPTKGASSSMLACEIFCIEPNCLSRRVLRFSPTPGI